MKVPFYILGLLLRYGPKSGYSLKQIIENQISDFAKIKLPIIYYHLQKLKDKNFVISKCDKEGNRPEKEIYTITESGHEYFNKLLVKELNNETEFEFSLDGIFYFNDYIDKTLLIDSLTKKRDKISEKLSFLELHKEDNSKIMKSELFINARQNALINASIIFNHHIVHLEAELSWLNDSIKELSR